MTQKNLILTVGLPRSGKSTWSRQTGVPMVNPDSIRLALHGQRYLALMEPYVWAMARTMVRALFLSGHDTVILDATNLDSGKRQMWLSKEWTCFYKVVETSEEECLRRAALTDDEEIVPVIQEMALLDSSLNDMERITKIDCLAEIPEVEI